MRYQQQITVRVAPTVQDSYTGDERQDWDQATSDTRPAEVQPASTTELSDRRQVTVTRWTVNCLPPAFPATARVAYDGADYEVDGEVGVHHHRGRPHHLEFTIRRLG